VTGKAIDADHQCCPTDFKCVESSAQYSQCLPLHTPPSSPPHPPPVPPGSPPPPPSPPKSPPPPPSPPSPPPVPSGTCSTAKYAQCAGKGFTKEVCCPSNFVCAEQDDFYSQCVPAGHLFQQLPAVAAICPTKGYAQCGGVDQVTGKAIDADHQCCPTDFKCVESSAQYSQCLPLHTPPSSPPHPPPVPPGSPPPPPSPPKSPPPPPSPPSPPPVPSGTCSTAKYAQCAGKGFTKAVCCPSGFTCTKQSDFYSQCMPTAAPNWFNNVFSKLTLLKEDA